MESDLENHDTEFTEWYKTNLYKNSGFPLYFDTLITIKCLKEYFEYLVNVVGVYDARKKWQDSLLSVLSNYPDTMIVRSALDIEGVIYG